MADVVQFEIKLAPVVDALAASRSLPVDISSVLRDIGVGLIVTAGAKAVGHGRLENDGGCWKVVVLRTESGIASETLTWRERFTVAHEVAHYLVETRLSYRPRSRREYWALEATCNALAARLLVPEHTID